MKIFNPVYSWARPLTPRQQATHLILHHSGVVSASAENSYDLSLGWVGIAYHFLVCKDGTIYTGRPIAFFDGEMELPDRSLPSCCKEWRREDEEENSQIA